MASLLGPQEGGSSKILPNARFFKVGMGNMSKNVYLCIFVLIYGIRYISCIWIKQINSECNHVGIYNVQKGLTSYYIITLRSKNQNNAFKAVKFTKLKKN